MRALVRAAVGTATRPGRSTPSAAAATPAPSAARPGATAAPSASAAISAAAAAAAETAATSPCTTARLRAPGADRFGHPGWLAALLLGSWLSLPATAQPAAADAAGSVGASHESEQSSEADDWQVLAARAGEHFAAGRLEAALDDFEAALGVAPPERRPRLHFNRGACLFQLARFEQAEQAFRSAAEAPGSQGEPSAAALGGLAWLNAGYAALELGAAARARAHLERARQADVDGALDELLAELGAELAPAAAEIEPEPGLAAYRAGVSAYERGQREPAQEQLQRALQRGLEPERQAAARLLLDAIAGGLRAQGPGLALEAAVGGGYDSNVVRTGIGAAAPLMVETPERGSPLLYAEFVLGYGLGAAPWLSLRAEYGLSQLLYTRGAFDLFNSQDHGLELAAELRPAPWLRLGVAGLGELAFAGLRDFRLLTRSAGLRSWLAWAPGLRHEFKLSGRFRRVAVADGRFDYLGGRSWELSLGYGYRTTGISLLAELGLRRELLGSQRVVTAAPPEIRNFWLAGFEIPLSHDAPEASVSVTIPTLGWMDVVAGLVYGQRRYHEPTRLVVLQLPDNSSVAEDVRTQRDHRFGARCGLNFELGTGFELYGGYEFGVVRSTIDNTAGPDHRNDYANMNFERHLLELELGFVTE